MFLTWRSPVQLVTLIDLTFLIVWRATTKIPRLSNVQNAKQYLRPPARNLPAPLIASFDWAEETDDISD